MIEHIFRNINDIRVFDLMTSWLGNGLTLEIDDVMELLEYPEYKRLEVEDTIEHFIRNKILAIKKIPADSWSGCKICEWTDKFKFPRLGEHKKHVPYKYIPAEVDSYYMLKNELTECLISAVFAHVFTVDVPDDEKDEIRNMIMKSQGELQKIN